MALRRFSAAEIAPAKSLTIESAHWGARDATSASEDGVNGAVVPLVTTPARRYGPEVSALAQASGCFACLRSPADLSQYRQFA
jgi:hypothetical protein